MTTAQIARDAAVMLNMTTYRPETPTATCPVVRRMDAIEAAGKYDKTEDGLRRSRYGLVGGVQCMVQVAVSGDGLGLSSETLLIFWSMEDNHQRRLLVTGLGDVLMDTGRRCIKIGKRNKYFDAVAAILRARAN